MEGWKKLAEKLKFEENKSWTQVADELKPFFPDLDKQQVFEKIRSVLRKTDTYKNKGKITYEDKKEPTKQDIKDYYELLKQTNNSIMKLEKKQTKTSIHIAEQKPIGVAFWGDWHIGAKGVDYEQFDKDLKLIKETDGLYSIGMGDYKDNANSLIHATSTQENIATADLQDEIVLMKMEEVKDRQLAVIRGCHDDWDKRLSNKDFVEYICSVTEAINLWHGGIINLTVGEIEYRIGARHKYKNESGLNTTNTQRNFVNEYGHCDTVAVAHKHFCEMQRTTRMGEDTIYLRSGTYKHYDEFGQKLAGYEGIYGVPVVIYFPNRKEMLGFTSLNRAVEMLKKLR